MINGRLDETIKSYYVTEGYDIVKYSTLSESDKVMFSKNIVAEIVSAIEDRKYAMDNEAVSKSKGDITKLDSYTYIKSSLDLLNNMQASLNEQIPYLTELNSAHQNLIKYASKFEKGYKLKKDVIEIFYSSLVLALIQSISFLISVSIDYIKDPMGNYQSSVRYGLKKNNDYPTINIECLAKFNLMSNNGDMELFFNQVFLGKLNEGVFGDAICLVASLFGDFAEVLKSVFTVVPTIPDLLRMIVSSCYFNRVKISDYLKLQAYYLELNIERQRNLQHPNKDSIKKQEKTLKLFLKLADKIDIDQKMSSKNAKIEIEKQNKNISKSIKDGSLENSSTSNDGNGISDNDNIL